MKYLEQTNETKLSWRQEEAQEQFKALSSRDVQLWSLTISTMIVFAVGFITMVLPTVSFSGGLTRQNNTAPFFFGLIGLVILFNLYIMSQRKTVAMTRWQLVQELMANERLASVSLVDPLTQLLNRQSEDLILSREVARANRTGSSLSFIFLALQTPPASGHKQLTEEEKAKRIAAAAKLARETFRGLDLVLRYSAESFLVVLPDTNEQQAECALRRLNTKVDEWNLTTQTGVELTFSAGLSSYVQGVDVHEVIRQAQRKLALKQNQLLPDIRFRGADPRAKLSACIKKTASAPEPGEPASGKPEGTPCLIEA